VEKVPSALARNKVLPESGLLLSATGISSVRRGHSRRDEQDNIIWLRVAGSFVNASEQRRISMLSETD
jgi:hypothetical protein